MSFLSRLSPLVATSVAAVVLAVPLRANDQSRETSNALVKMLVTCEQESERLWKQKPVRIGESIRPPKLIRKPPLQYPEQAGTVGSGMWIGHALVSPSGTVAKVWTVREISFAPPFPAFNQAIVDGIERSEYEPLIVDGHAVPFCMTVTMNINWR